MQAQTGLLIGGRVALDFIRRDLCLEDTMDTFVNRRSVLDVASTLENLDYRYVPDVLPLRTIAEAVDYKADRSTFNSSVVGVHVFRHSSGKRIVVHVARTSTVDCILGYGTSEFLPCRPRVPLIMNRRSHELRVAHFSIRSVPQRHSYEQARAVSRATAMDGSTRRSLQQASVRIQEHSASDAAYSVAGGSRVGTQVPVRRRRSDVQDFPPVCYVRRP